MDRCRGAEDQRCRGGEVQRCRDAEMLILRCRGAGADEGCREVVQVQKFIWGGLEVPPQRC